jgi:hypothetical protein
MSYWTKHNTERISKLRDYWSLVVKRESLILTILGLPVLLMEFFVFGWFLDLLKGLLTFIKPHFVVDLFVIILLGCEVIILYCASSFEPFTDAQQVSAIVFLIAIILNVFQTWINIFLTKEQSHILDPLRSLLMVFVNYGQLCLAFLILVRICGIPFCPSIYSFKDSAYLTIGTMTAIGAENVPLNSQAWALYIAELFFGILFLTVIVSRVIELFRDKTKSRPRRSFMRFSSRRGKNNRNR